MGGRMKFRNPSLSGLFGLILIVLILIPSGSALAKGILKYSCSAQVYQAFENQRLDAFTKETGIRVELSILSSYKAFLRLMNGYSDIASMARRLVGRHREAGFLETIFCKDPIAIIVNSKSPIANFTEDQLREIFGGGITNWKQIGGPDQPIIVIIPGEETAAYKNFSRKLMPDRDMDFDIMTAQSTMVIEATGHFPWSISFIAQGAAAFYEKQVEICKINGFAPRDAGYPYYQEFSFVTKGKPSNEAKAFIDFAFSDEGKKIICDRGMIPLAR
jgi:phosphate transport system substrate-binding protein